MQPLRSPQNAGADLRDEAFEIIRKKSFFRGEITLASGRKSDFYFDMKPTMFTPAGAHALAELLLERLATVRPDYVAGVAVGAIPLVSNVTMLSAAKGRPLPGFFVRKDVKDHGTKRKLDGLAHDASLAGKRVAIVEDVTTTGGSSMIAVNAAREAGAEVVLVLSIVDRGEGAAETYREAGVPFASLFTADEFKDAK
ncbi:MAG: orotate phosphoribosyltransferase [Variibacter sp.]|jgi:orotate phosphoribosyltransferase|nr:orotate phosphoribosyltransferase [Variibacter sp.]